MRTQPKARMTVDEFLVWAGDRPGRYELVDGEVVAMAPERARHAKAKFAAQTALLQAIRRARVNCDMLPDGMTVRIDERTAYEPDALVYCGPRIAGDAIEVENPLIVVEVLSPGTGSLDSGAKLIGYFKVASIMHYLVVDPVRRIVMHHRRGERDFIDTRILSEGMLKLDPPGIEMPVADTFVET